MKSYLLSCLLFVCYNLKAQEQGNIVVTFKDIKNKGVLRIIICNSQKDFQIFTTEKKICSFKKRQITVKGEETIKTVFEDIPNGAYTIVVLLDENENKKMDKFMGIPTEQYGFSNNPDILPYPPSYKKCAFIVNGDISLTINLK